MPRDPVLHSKCSKYAMAAKYHPGDLDKLAALRADMLAEKVVVLIRKVYEQVNLDAEQQQRIIAAVVTGGVPVAADATGGDRD